MAIATTLRAYLDAQGVAYEIVTHKPAMTAMAAARSAGVDGACMAKAVVLEDESGRYVLALVPASHHVRLRELDRTLERHVGLATERELPTIFADCALGAVPPVGAPYGIEVVVDDSLSGQEAIYFEGGDHCTLVRVLGADFARLTAAARHGRFSAPA